MVVFEVSLNGEPLCRAGVGESGVLTAIVTWFGPKEAERSSRPETLDFSVGGVASATFEHLDWVRRPLAVGDRITIEIAEGGDIEVPRKRKPMERHEPPDPSKPVELALVKGARGR
jgi:hypothetical protein